MKKKFPHRVFIWGIFLLLCFLIPNSKANPQTIYNTYLPIIFKPRSHYYAQVTKSGIFYGVWATIQTANPVIREPLFSYASINILDDYGRWVETGWIKGSITGCVPKFTWAIQPGSVNIISYPLPSVGIAYQYRIHKISNGNWTLTIMRTDGTVIQSVNIYNPGMDYGSSLQAVGEVDSVSKINDMGVSGILSLKWRDISLNWFNWDGWNYGVIDNPPYHIVGIQSNPYNNVQIYGNNGNPIPPGAPCP